ncbi:hypothetical protein [Methylomonas sp. TEB]|uniref:hypothetical protein n=1 Tax=Methylomonas sp. TEB TaxID=3398229 RepID=UPI0039F50BB9
MQLSKMTDDQRKSFKNALAHKEVYFARNDPKEWPSLFFNIIKPKIKTLNSAIEFYESLTDKEIETRLAVHHWEAQAWDVYEALMGCGLLPMGRSIDPKRWAEKEIDNVNLLLTEGRNQLMTSREFYEDAIPLIYNQLVIGEWNDFISTSIDELNSFYEEESKYYKKHGYDEYDPIDIDFKILCMAPKEEDFLNEAYLAAMEIQALIWYREFLTEIKIFGVTFYDGESERYENIDSNQPRRKYININQLNRLLILSPPQAALIR